ncbi:hypothetical protein RHGRI_020760 [Rhododendron griersonianum]|uniref:Uncharacterized protein n=1 Tax=Rhododendron griersonianum TaxID=479676 RepID=A0AAV6JLV7_9ERIC|nr:hypothetical protein RHGRI_020760 [Rhododendron griersonianum]
MSFHSLSSLQYASFFSKPFHGHKLPSSRIRASSDVPDFLSADWLESRRKRPFGPRLKFSAEEAVRHQLDALMFNDQPCQDHGIEVMYRFAGFDPFERSTYFGPYFDLGQFQRFRRIFHHSTPQGKEDLEQFDGEGVDANSNCQRVGGSWDGYWLTESLLHDCDSFSRGVVY